MSSDTNPVTSSSNTEATVSTGSTAPTGQAGEFNASTPVSNMEDLKTKAPAVYKAMMEGIATNIINQMKHHQDKLKEMMREAARDAAGQS